LTTAPSTLLVLRLSALGDIIHTIPAVRALQDAGAARVGWIVEQPYRELVERVARPEAVFTVATKRWRREPFSPETRSEIVAGLGAARRFALGGRSVDFQGLVKSALLGWTSGATERFGFDRQAIREKPAGLFLNRRVAVNREAHVVEWNLELARAAGARAAVPPHVDFGPLALSDEALVPYRNRIVLVPGAGQETKCWPTSSFSVVARELWARTGSRPVVVWGPGERLLAEAVGRNGDAEVAVETNLRRLAFTLQMATLVIAGDTGPLHLAAALGTPVVGLYGPTNPARNGPWGQLDRCLSTWDSSRRVASIDPDEVVRMALTVLG
jgi:heptosyltransferase-1